jgi:hypothetical protein
MNELRECPFCGIVPEYPRKVGDSSMWPNWRMFHICKKEGEDPGITQIEISGKTKEQCIAAWNRRATGWIAGFEVKGADGSDIDYEKLGHENGLCSCDIDGFYVGEDGQLLLVDDCGKCAWLDRKDYRITPLPTAPEDEL